ncbi:MAG TPA: hypothetical protein VGF54_21380, partial [Streptosporangiaceae bacterium]
MTRTTAPWRVPACLVAAAALAVPLMAAAPAAPAHASPAMRPARATAISPPVPHGTLQIAGRPRDGSVVRAAGLSWRPSPLPPGDTLLSFEVGYTWQACAARSGGQGRQCAPGADATVTPFAARRYIAGHGDTGKYLKLTATATEVVETDPATFTFRVIRSSRSYTAPHRVRR